MYDTQPQWQGLLAPVTPDCPAGSDPRSNSLFLQTRDIRSAARESERLRAQGNPCDSVRLQAQWQQVATKCCEILLLHGKDLDICAWLIEAWARIYSTRGIAAGFALYHALLSSYWDCLFPSPEAVDDHVARVAALNALNGGSRIGTLIEATNHFYLTGVDGDEGSTRFTLWQYRAALEAQRLNDEDQHQRRLVDLGFSLQQIQLAADDTDVASFQLGIADCDAAQAALRALDDALHSRLGSLSPPTTMIHAALDTLRDALVHLAGARMPSSISAITPLQENTETRKPDLFRLESASALMSPLTQRQQAIAVLDHAARYFRTMEPHSPLAGAIDRLIRWAGMSCEELLRELIPEPAARDALYLMTGITPEVQVRHTNN